MKLSLSTEACPPFFEAHHRALAEKLARELGPLEREEDPARAAAMLGEALGLYAFLLPEREGGAAVGAPEDGRHVDVRALALIREALGQVSPLADAIFAVQGLGSYPLVLAGSEAQKRAILPDLLAGRTVCAFALTETEAGSDVASLRASARREGNTWVLDGEKTLISNVPLARHHVVFVNADPEAGRKGITAFLVPSSAEGLERTPIATRTSHPLGALSLRSCRVPDSARVGAVGEGFKIAMATLDAFRISVGAAAVGMGQRALSLATRRVMGRRQFGAPLSEQPIVRAMLADASTDLEAARLLVARAAHKRDVGRSARVTKEAAMAKMFATEAAFRAVDVAVQLHGGLGVTLGSEVERLAHDVRPLRIYEGTTEIQKLIIAKALLEEAAEAWRAEGEAGSPSGA